MAAKRWDIEDHRDYPGSVEYVSGSNPNDDQVLTAAEIVALKNVADDHADTLDDIGPTDTDYLSIFLAEKETQTDVYDGQSDTDYLGIFQAARESA